MLTGINRENGRGLKIPPGDSASCGCRSVGIKGPEVVDRPTTPYIFISTLFQFCSSISYSTPGGWWMVNQNLAGHIRRRLRSPFGHSYMLRMMKNKLTFSPPIQFIRHLRLKPGTTPHSLPFGAYTRMTGGDPARLSVYPPSSKPRTPGIWPATAF